MRLDAGDISDAEVQSALEWWIGAGVDTILDEAPRDWLKRATSPSPAAPAEPVAASLPSDLATFREWLATTALPAGGGGRVLPTGDPAAGLMILADMPEAGDAVSGTLIGGEVGALFDRMLAAIARDRASIYLASLSPTRFPAGKIPVDALTALSPIARRHVALVAPRMLLLLGDAPSVALLGQPMVSARGRLHKINLDGATVDAVASFHPRLLLQRPACKAEAWADLQLMLGGMSQ